MTIIFDLETNGFLLDVTKIHCIALKIDDKPTVCYTDIEEAISILKKADRLVGHNIIKYDIPVINKLYNINLYSDSVFDTLLASKLSYPNLSELDSGKGFTGKIVGSHSLKAWGYRLGNHKIDFGKDDETAWDYVTDEMIEYCIQDVNVTASLYKRLLKRNIPDEALRLENAFANIIGRQEQYGVLFDTDKAIQLTVELKREQDEMEANLYKIFKPMYLADGKLKTQAEYKTKFPFRNIYGSHQPIKLTTFNPGSRQHIVKWLHHLYKWKPTKLTDKGSPIVDESVLSELPYEEAKVLSRYFTVKKLLGQLSEGDNAWLNMVKKDGRIHGSVDTIGAVSRRCTHSRPNMAQVPSTRAFKGKECRALFTVPKGKKLVGCDADGLELRTLSHYMARYDNSAYAKAVDEGKKENGTDIHTVNQKAAGLATRDEAKTFIYAFLYGAGDEKIGTIVGGGKPEGTKLKNKFFKQLPAIKQLIEAVVQSVKDNGNLKALDGNPYYIRSSHSALNTLLQGAGALVMKYWLIELDKNLEKVYTNSSLSKTPQYEFVLNIHDEAQIECDEDIAEDVLAIAVKTFDDVTKLLKFRIPLRGSGSIGDNWCDTH